MVSFGKLYVRKVYVEELVRIVEVIIEFIRKLFDR